MIAPLSEIIDQYGYVAVFVGSLLEGETILLVAGLAAHQGYLSLPLVVAVAFCGGTLGDQLLFHLGRVHGSALLCRYPSLAARAEPVQALIVRHQSALIVGVRFMYGVRLIGPFVIGTSAVSPARFALLNMLGAAIWAPLVAGAGYLFGQTMGWLFTELGRYEAIGLLVVVAGAALLWFVRRWRARRT